MIEGGIDIHSHILPHTDDGAVDWEDTALLASEAASQGFRHIIATPHFSRKADPSSLLEKYANLVQKGRLWGIPISFSLGQEIRYFEEMADWLDQGKALTLAGSRYVLTEFSPEDSFTAILRGIRQLALRGYLPVVAHAERYGCLYEKGRLEEVIRGGGYIQVNYTSLEGLLRPEVRWCRRQLLEGRVHFLGTDMHRKDYRPPRTLEAQRWIEKKGGEKLLRRLMIENPRCILENRILKQ